MHLRGRLVTKSSLNDCKIVTRCTNDNLPLLSLFFKYLGVVVNVFELINLRLHDLCDTSKYQKYILDVECLVEK